MVAQPQGTVSFLFSDIERSTRLLQMIGPEQYAEALAKHGRLLRQAFQRFGGFEVDQEGDEFFVAFERSEDAVVAAAEAQRALAAASWPGGHEVRVRMGIHTGEPLVDPPRYVGLDVHVAARIMAAAHGGQVLVSDATRRLAEPQLDASIGLRDLGDHRLKDVRFAQRLHQLVISGLLHDFPPPRSLTIAGQLPSARTSAVGRERELAEICALLARRDLRLLTLTGAGGSGKTWLALQAAVSMSDEFRDGARFVDLAPVESARLLPSTIVHTLGLADQAGSEPGELLHEYLRERELLMLLDNLEHMLDGVAFLAELISACPRLKLLVTSREPLHLTGEHEYGVPPLDETAAVELFYERARAVKADFGDGDAVLEICRRVDALPLAIELAAARVKALSAPQILARLDQRLPLLAGGPRDAPARQRTLRATIDWSYNLLNARERQLFTRLSVFTGGCTLEAAEAVCDADVDTLQALVDKSLLGFEAERYTMLATVREYAVEQLAGAGLTNALQERHAEYFLALAEEAAPQLRSGRADRHWLQLLERERDNFRAALRWLVDRHEGEPAQRLVCALFLFWHDRGPVGEACEWIAQTLELPAGATWRARTLGYGSILAFHRGDYHAARHWAEDGVALAREAGDELARTAALQMLGSIAFAHHAAGEGARLLEEALEAARATGDEWSLGVSLVTLLSHEVADDPARVQTLEREGAALRDVGSSTRALLRACRGISAERRGEYGEAMAHYRDSVVLAREIEFDKTPALLMNLGWLTLLSGDLVTARSQLMAAATEAAERGTQAYAAAGVALLARLAAAEGQTLLAVTLWGAVEEYRRTATEVPFGQVADGTFSKYFSEMRERVGYESWTEAFARGSRMSISDALRHALEQGVSASLERVRA